MKQNYKIYLCALLLVGAVNTMTIGALGADKPTLAVFVVGGNNSHVAPLTTALRTNLTSGGRYTLTSVSTNDKLTELQAAYTAGSGSSINRNALAEWGRDNSISTICLVVDDVKGNDHLFSAQLIDTKDSKLSGKGSYVRTGVAVGDVARVSLALTKQLEGPGRVARKGVTSTRKWFEPEMVQVEGGTTTLGWHAAIDADRTDGAMTSSGGNNNNILAQYTATVPNFKIGKYEVTQLQWRTVMSGTKFENYFYFGGSRGVVNGALNSVNCGNVDCDDQRPVEYVTWHLAVAFCNKLSEMAGLTPYYSGANLANIGDDGNCTSCSVAEVSGANGYRLPTQNQWEYAARGCKAGSCENFKYSGSNTILEVAWHSSNSNSTTHPVGQLKPNGLGIYDMSGNVWELCWEILSGSNHVVHGGSWLDAATSGWHRLPTRWAPTPNYHTYPVIGFRVVLP